MERGIVSAGCSLIVVPYLFVRFEATAIHTQSCEAYGHSWCAYRCVEQQASNREAFREICQQLVVWREDCQRLHATLRGFGAYGIPIEAAQVVADLQTSLLSVTG